MNKIKLTLAILLIIVASVAVMASGDENKAKKSDGSSSNSGSKDEVFAIGENVTIGDWEIKAYGLIDPVTSTNEFSDPAEGNRFVGVDLEVKNLSDKAVTVSSLICYELKDADNKTYDVGLAVTDQAAAPEGNLNAGEVKRGVVVFEVPQAATGFTFSFSCDLGSSGAAQIKLS